MKDNINSIKFNLTPLMAQKLIEFNNLKKELNSLKNKDILEQNDIKQIKNIEDKLNQIRIEFIKEFRINNKEEILKYLNNK